MKKRIAVFVAAGMLLTATSCSKAPVESQKETQPETTVTSTTQSEESAYVPDTEKQYSSDVDAQMEIIAGSYGFIKSDYSAYLEAYSLPSFAVTDLNHNGRLEVIVSAITTSGALSNTFYYEISEDYSTLERLRVDGEDKSDEAGDFLMSKNNEDHTSLYACYMKDGEYSVLAPLSFNLLGDDFPEYTKGKYLHELVKYGFNDYTWYTKSILFDPNKIKEINFGFGAHNSNPTGDVKWYRPDNLFLIHAKFLGLDYYMYRIKTRRISDTNRMCGLYAETEKNDSELRKTYFEHYGERFDWFDIKDNFETYYNTKQDWSIWGGAKR